MEDMIRAQLMQIQQHLIVRSNISNTQNSVTIEDFFQTGTVGAIERLQNAILVSSVYNNMLDQIDHLLDGSMPASEYSAVVLLTFAIGQLVIIRAYGKNRRKLLGGLSEMTVQQAEDEIVELINYLAQYTGRDVLPRF